MSTIIVIKLPKKKSRIPVEAFTHGKPAKMRDRRERRAKDARRSWKREEW